MSPRSEWHPYAFMDGVFSEEECATIKALGEGRWTDAYIGGKNPRLPTYLYGQHHVLPKDPDHAWIYDRLIEPVDYLQREYLPCRWDRWVEPIQVSYYDAGREHRWHIDYGAGQFLTRKLIVSVLLDQDFNGGDLEIQAGNSPVPCEQRVGRMIVMPTTTLHRVTPVTQGERTTLVTWGHGPRWE